MSKILASLVKETGLNRYDLVQLISTAPRRYKFYTIPKKNGELRSIAQPAREVKALQRAFIRSYLVDLPVHSAATAYKKGSGIRKNAGSHAGFGCILKMDFKDFFPSIRAKDWMSYCEARGLFDEVDIKLSTLLLFHKPRGRGGLCLSIGAPSSPLMSNILMYEFDRLVTERVSRHKIAYTRYADDLTFSAPRAWNLRDAHKAVVDIVRELSGPSLDINADKTVFATTQYKRAVTGLILANDGRVTIGKEKKRQIRAEVHHYVMGALEEHAIIKLGGKLAFVNNVEPEFLEVLRRKYTADAVRQLLHRSGAQAQAD